MKRTHIMFIALLLSLVSISAQPPIRLRVREQIAPDSLDLAYYGKPHYWRAAATVAGLNLSVWAFDRYVQHGDFSYISLNTVKENFRHFLIWDNDRLSTNMFLHPYHGNLYFNSARANGLNFWQSSLYAFGGSAMWEFFMECEYPSTNDIICTPIGGMAIGEVMFRASDIVLNDRTRGWERFGREAAAFLISPMRGLTRIINGDAWRHRDTSGRQFGIPNIAMEYSMGIRALEFQGPFFDTGVGFTSELNIEYGDRFDLHNPKPYDYFTFRADLNLHSSQPLLDQLNIMGRLLVKDIIDTKNQDLNIGLYQHFDYYDSDTISALSPKVPYRLATPASFGCGMMYRYREPRQWAFDAYAHANAVLLAGVISDYYFVDERDYNLASGFSVKSGFNMVFARDKFSFSGIWEYFRLFTLKGYAQGTDLARVNYRTLNAEGNPSADSFIVAEARIDYRIWKRLYASGALSMFHRSTRYKGELPDVKTTTTATRLMFTYKF